MSFECKFYDKGWCIRLQKNCHPGTTGCVLHGKVRFIKPPPPEKVDKELPDSSPEPLNDKEPHQPH